MPLLILIIIFIVDQVAIFLDVENLSGWLKFSEGIIVSQFKVALLQYD